MKEDDDWPDDEFVWGKRPSLMGRLMNPLLAALAAYAWIGGLSIVARLDEIASRPRFAALAMRWRRKDRRSWWAELPRR